MTTPALACAGLEIALNRYLRLERSALEECAALDGKSIALHLADLGWTFVVEPHAAGVRVLAESEIPPDVRVAAPSMRLLQLALRSAGGAEGLPAGLEVEGDTELLTRFNALLARVGFDPEELAAKVLGDAAAHRVVGGLRELFGWGRHAAQRLSQDAAEYLSEETGDLARAGDIEEWMQGVEALREGADRLEARLALLEGKTEQPS
ncbi:ubiquinone biosynthesis accessory factor UbiJ [Nevskia soli]|uniref:ubiquinone biosynthesis accessory factor UbiJ n=1 Tax=Nevskia soli TaxID=418856 RepID=UPI00068A343B|nr:SCP2 sterol-binding domain-containing protein [Nevskia soli]